MEFRFVPVVFDFGFGGSGLFLLLFRCFVPVVSGFSTCRHLVGQIFLYFHQLVDFNLATKCFSNMLFLFIYLQKKLALATLQLI